VKRTDADHLDDALTHLRVLHEHLMLTEAHDQVVLDAAALRRSREQNAGRPRERSAADARR